MGSTLRFERTLMALISSAACSVACGGTVADNGTGAGGSGAGATGKTSGGTLSAGTSSAAGGSSGAGPTCEQAKDGYTVLLANLLSESASTLCSANSECGFVPTSECGNECSISIVNTAASAAISAQLGAFAKANCESCKFSVLPCLTPYFPAFQCVAGACKL